MAKDQKYKKYYAAKHFFHYIKPGSRRIESFSTNDDVLILAVKSKRNKLTFVLINKGKTPCTITLVDITKEKKDYHNCHDNYDTNGYNVIFTDKDNNCVELEPLGPDHCTLMIPPESIMTLQRK